MNLNKDSFNLFKKADKIKKGCFYMLVFLVFAQGTVFGQETDVNVCNFTFAIKIEKQDSIALRNETGDIVKYWKQSDGDYTTSFTTIDRSSKTISRIKSINQYVINFGEDGYSDTQLDSLNQSLKGLWVSNEILETNFAEWIYLMNRSGLKESVNPENKNEFFMYARPTKEAYKTPIDINDLYEGDSYEILYNILVLECKGQWVKLKISSDKLKVMYTGWMPWYNVCYNFLTTCAVSDSAKKATKNAE